MNYFLADYSISNLFLMFQEKKIGRKRRVMVVNISIPRRPVLGIFLKVGTLSELIKPYYKLEIYMHTHKIRFIYIFFRLTIDQVSVVTHC